MLAFILAWKAKGVALWAASKAKIGLYAIIAVAALVVAGFIYSMGASRERAKCDSAALRSEIATLKKDLATIRKAAADERAKATTLDTLAEKQAQELKDYKDAVEKLKGACRLSPGDARGLQR